MNPVLVQVALKYFRGSPSLRVPHPRDVFVLVARVGWHESNPHSFTANLLRMRTKYALNARTMLLSPLKMHLKTPQIPPMAPL